MTIHLGYKYIITLAVSSVFSFTCAAQSAVIHPDLPGYSQKKYEEFETCAGEFLAKQGLLKRIKNDLDDPYAKFVKSAYESGVSIAGNFETLRADLKSLPGTLDHVAGQTAYLTGRKKFDEAAASSAGSQYNLFRENRKVSQPCIDHYLDARTFVLTWKSVEKKQTLKFWAIGLKPCQ